MLLTPETREEELKEMMRGVESACSQLNMEVMGGHTEITDVVKHPLISVTGVGTIKKEEVLVTSSVKPGQDIVITKWIGLEGTSIAAKEKEAELLERFAHLLWRQQNTLTSIFLLCRKQKSQKNGAYLPCMILQEVVSLAHSGKWEVVRMLVLILI